MVKPPKAPTYEDLKASQFPWHTVRTCYWNISTTCIDSFWLERRDMRA